MKAVVQCVLNASVTVDKEEKGRIKSGLLVYFGAALSDTEKDADRLAEKIANLRIFADNNGKMNLSIKEIAAANPCAGVLVISQFTLLADARKGRRPSYNNAAPPEKAKKLYEYFISKIRVHGLLCESGEFQTHMMVNYTNDGPVTILLDTENLN